MTADVRALLGLYGRIYACWFIAANLILPFVRGLIGGSWRKTFLAYTTAVAVSSSLVLVVPWVATTAV